MHRGHQPFSEEDGSAAVNVLFGDVKEMAMNAFDKVCATFAFILGVVFLVLGAIGLVAGCRANFTLPPILGALPALIGWGIVRAVYLAWNRPGRPIGASDGDPNAAEDWSRD
jgi:hypothetical protein